MEETPKPIKSRSRMLAMWVMLLAGLVALAFFQMRGPRMPVYQGKPLSKWFEDFERASQMQLAGGPMGGMERSSEAFRQLGQKAVPYLIHELTNTSGLKEKYVSMKSSAPGWAFKVLPRVQVGAWANRTAAAMALGEIGPTATNAIPYLIEAVSKSDISETDKSTGASNGRSLSPHARVAAIQALIKIAPNSHVVVSALIEALKQKYVRVPFKSPTITVTDVAAATLTNLGYEFKDQIPVMIANLKYQDQRQFRGAGISAIYSVGSLAPGYREHVPRLMAALKDADTETRDAATYDLGALRPREQTKAKAALPPLEEALNDSQASIRIRVAETILVIDFKQSKTVLPTLINLLSETNYLVRLRAIDLLRQIGTDAKDAVPSLTNALRDDSRTIQTWASEALKRIEPEAAMKAVVK